MALFLLLLVIAFIGSIHSFYHNSFGHKWNGLRSNTCFRSLEKRIIEIPQQQDLSQYRVLLEKSIDPERIIRWYITKFVEEVAQVEVVYDRSPELYIPESFVKH